MEKTTFRTFATFTVLLLVLATTFTLIFGLCDAHIFAPLDIASAASVEASTSADDYYASVENLTTDGASFRSSLASLITSTHKSQPTYKNLINVFPDTDANPDNENEMLWFYTGTVAKSSTNREHVWPKDGGKAFPAESQTGSDAHHLRPTDQQLNSSRGSLSFGEVSQTAGNIVKEYGSTTYDNLCYRTSQYFYPGVGYRGATARILMYVQTRWGDAYNLQFVLGDGNCKTIGDIATLMKWHLEEPVTEAEILRNEAVYKIQGNRNPFIDHPEYAERIYCYDGKSYNTELKSVVAQYGTSESITSLALKNTEMSLCVGETTTLSPIYTPSNAIREVNWTSSNPSVATVSANGKVTAIANGTATITVSSKADATIKASATITVKSVSSISVSGQPKKTTYNSGETFDTTGITVTALFTDNSTKIISNSSCQWLDGTTRTASLSAGTTSVICNFISEGKTFSSTINGITVSSIVNGGSTLITLDDTTASGKYDWYAWSADDLSGQCCIYANKDKSAMQMNKKSGIACYFYNTTPVPNSIVSIKITLAEGSDKSFDIYTSNTPYSSGTSFPTTGTKRGTLTADTNGVTLDINTTDRYFTINYNGSNACYIESIEILYGGSDSSVVPDKDDTPYIDPNKTYTAQDFVDAVNAINNSTTIEEKKTAIEYAETIFNCLSTDEKTKAETQNAYGKLLDNKQEYNRQLQAKPEKDTLSGGEIAGIVIGSVVGATLIAIALYILIKRTQTKHASRE